MARIKVARGSKTNLPGALDENTLLYGEMYWEKEEDSVSDGVLYMGKPDGVENGTDDKDPLAIAGARAMKSLFFQGLWDPSGGAYPANPTVGDIYVANADGTGAASTFRYGDWAVCISTEGETSQWLKAINQAITTEDPLENERNPLQLNEGILKLKYDPATLKINEAGELTVSHVEVYTVESTETVTKGQPIALDSTGKAIVADFASEDTAIVIGVAQADAAAEEFVTVQRGDLVTLDSTVFTEVGAPVYLYIGGSYTQDVDTITPGNILQQVGIATAGDTIDVHIGTPFQIDGSSDIYYIPLTQSITEDDTTHAPSSKAVYDMVQQLTNVDTQLVSKTDTGLQEIAGSLDVAQSIEADTMTVSSMNVTGDLDVAGTVTTINTAEVEIADNIFKINSNQTGVPSGVLESGIEIERGDETNYRLIFAEDDNTFKAGESGSEQILATRADTLGDQTLPLWDDTQKTFIGSGIEVSAGKITADLEGQADGADKVGALLVQTDAWHEVPFLSGFDTDSNASVYIRDYDAPVFRFNPNLGNLEVGGEITADKVFNAVWNDIADLIEVPGTTNIEYGKVYVMDENENYSISGKYLDEGIIGIASDTYGFGVGQKEQVKQLPVAIGGFVLAFTDKVYKPGTPLTATAEGFLTEIKLEDKRDYPERIIATFWKPEKGSDWNGITVNGRHWVKVK